MSEAESCGIVEVLYDYSYEDESGKVTISVGDRYILLERTDPEWWHVRPADDDESFYVPAQYVRILAEDEDSLYANQGDCLPDEAEGADDATTPPTVSDGRGPPYDREEVFASSDDLNRSDTVFKEEVLYENLDSYRVDVILPSLSIAPDVKQGPVEYANLPLIGEGENSLPPTPSEGDQGRRLVDYLPWFIYNEHGLGRPFYVNVDTGERTFKPPRHKNQKLSDRLSPVVTKVNFDVALVPDDKAWQLEYDEVKEDRKVYYVHKKSKEKYLRSEQSSGNQYYYHIKSGESFWELPSSSSPRVPNGESVDENRNRHHTHSLRLTKAKSMYVDSDSMKEDVFKAATLPSSFTYNSSSSALDTTGLPDSPRSMSPALKQEPIIEYPQSNKPRSASPAFRFPEQLLGNINKAKITEVGKKVKKTWSQSYCVLRGSNLVFYKDVKASQPKLGSPNGKPELIVSLHGAKVDFLCNSDISSRKNVITLTVTGNTQFLLQADEEPYVRRWFVGLKMAANDIDDKAREDYGKPMPRSQSVDESHPTAVGDRHPTYLKIREKLRNLISRRPPQEDLIKRGLIKELVFGSHLDDLCKREHNTVPNFVRRCVAAVERKGLDHDGLYRISGNLAEIQKLRYTVDKDDTYNLDSDEYDINVLTGALKLFFRELKEPLFPFKMFDRFSDAIRKEKNSHKLKGFRELMGELPTCHRETMKVLFQHLKNVVDKSHQNRMQVQNVAIVFGPTLMWSESDTAGMAFMSILQSKVVEYVLLEFDKLLR